MCVNMGSPSALGSPTWALCTSTWALRASTWALQTAPGLQEPSWGRSRPVLGTPGGPPGAKKHLKNNGFYNVLHNFTVLVQRRLGDRPEGLQEPPRGAQKAPKRGPGGPRSGPGGTHDDSKSAKSAPRAPPEPPQLGFRAALAVKWSPTGTKEPSGGLPEAILDLRGLVFHPPGYDFRAVFFSRKACSKLSCGQSLRKHTHSTALCPCVASTCGLVRRRTADQ